MNFILSDNLKLTMNFPNEVPSFATHPIIPRYREIERSTKMSRMSQFASFYTFFQPA